MYPHQLIESSYDPDSPALGGSACIALPPPNITGSLHLGHALNAAIGDALIRRARRRDGDALWLPGTDHATTGTHIILERRLAAEGVSLDDLGREGFIEYASEYAGGIQERIMGQYRRLGASLDYGRARYTLDDAYAASTRAACVRLWDEGLIRRSTRLINWSPGLGSALSEMETEREPEPADLYWLRYPLDDGSALPIATTSPHTVAADAALCLHPSDARLEGLRGRRAINPITGSSMPIIADLRCDSAWGSGIMRITPAHDALDHEIGRDHGLGLPQALDERGMTDLTPWPGFSFEEGRRLSLELFTARGILERITPYRQSIPRCERTRTRIEAMPSDQWFLAVDELAPPIIEALDRGEIRCSSERAAAGLRERLENSPPWCISRQLWWGHRMPLWERDGEWRADDPGEGWSQSTDVLDTWFSSALWPFASLGWPERTADFERYYPTLAAVSGRDITGLWIGRMLMLGRRLTGRLPFTEIHIHPTILDRDGHRMSKSRGNGIDPDDLIARFGADATRWGLLRMCGTQDIRFREDDILHASRTLNKLYNSSRLLGGPTSETIEPETEAAQHLSAALDRAETEIERAFENSSWHGLMRILDRLIRDDWGRVYLEAAKADRAREWPYARSALGRILGLVEPFAPALAHGLLGGEDG